MVHSGFAKEARVEKFLLAVILLSFFIGRVDFCHQPLLIVLVLVAPQGQKRLPVVTRGLSASRPLIDRLLNCSWRKRLPQCA